MTGEDLYGLKVTVDKSGLTPRHSGPLTFQTVREYRGWFAHLARIGGLSVRQAGQVLKLPPSTVCSLLNDIDPKASHLGRNRREDAD